VYLNWVQKKRRKKRKRYVSFKVNHSYVCWDVSWWRSVIHTYEGVLYYVCVVVCVCDFFFLHRPYLFHMGMGEGLGGKIGLMSVMFHAECVVCGDVVIGDMDKGIVGMMAVGDCSEV
jgi:hypothetical protein